MLHRAHKEAQLFAGEMYRREGKAEMMGERKQETGYAATARVDSLALLLRDGGMARVEYTLDGVAIVRRHSAFSVQH